MIVDPIYKYWVIKVYTHEEFKGYLIDLRDQNQLSEVCKDIKFAEKYATLEEAMEALTNVELREYTGWHDVCTLMPAMLIRKQQANSEGFRINRAWPGTFKDGQYIPPKSIETSEYERKHKEYLKEQARLIDSNPEYKKAMITATYIELKDKGLLKKDMTLEEFLETCK